jgi:hypothetical protein
MREGKNTMVFFQKLMMEDKGSFPVRAEGSTRGRGELRPRAGAVPRPLENTPSSIPKVRAALTTAPFVRHNNGQSGTDLRSLRLLL